jgi:hypothetical protein
MLTRSPLIVEACAVPVWLWVRRKLLRRRADAGDLRATRKLAVLLRECGDRDALTARADTGDKCAADELANLLAARGDVDALTARADPDHVRDCAAEKDREYAAEMLAKLLFDRGDRDALTARADAGDKAAAWRLAVLLRRDDYVALVARAEAGDRYAAGELAAERAARDAAREWLGDPLTLGYARRNRRRDYDLPDYSSDIQL